MLSKRKHYDRQQLIRLFKEIGENKGIDVTKIQSALVVEDDFNNVYSILASRAMSGIEKVYEYSSKMMVNSLGTQNNILLSDENTPKYVACFNGDHSFDNVFNVVRKTIKDVNRNNKRSHIIFLESTTISGDGPVKQIMNEFLLYCVNRGIISAKIKTLGGDGGGGGEEEEFNRRAYFNGQKKEELIKPLLKRDSSDDGCLFNDEVNIYHVIGFVLLFCLYHDMTVPLTVAEETYLLLCAEANTLKRPQFIEQVFVPHIMGNLDLEVGKQNIIDMIVGGLPIKNLISQASNIGPNDEKFTSICIESLCIRSNMYDSKNNNILQCAKIGENFNERERGCINEWLHSLSSDDGVQKQVLKIITGSEVFSDFFICKNYDKNDNDNGIIRLQVCSKTIILPQSLFRLDQFGKDVFKDSINNYFYFAWFNSSSSSSSFSFNSQ